MKRIVKSWWNGMKTVAKWYSIRDYRVIPFTVI